MDLKAVKFKKGDLVRYLLWESGHPTKGKSLGIVKETHNLTGDRHTYNVRVEWVVWPAHKTKPRHHWYPTRLLQRVSEG
jgi:hypothetical protein